MNLIAEKLKIVYSEKSQPKVYDEGTDKERLVFSGIISRKVKDEFKSLIIRCTIWNKYCIEDFNKSFDPDKHNFMVIKDGRITSFNQEENFIYSHFQAEIKSFNCIEKKEKNEERASIQKEDNISIKINEDVNDEIPF